jgi:methionyl-tRNA formyltransferase
MADVLILGGTDVTIAVADAVLALGFEIRAVVTVGKAFDISYSKTPVASARFAPVDQWCAEHGIETIPFAGYDDVLEALKRRPARLCLAAGWYHHVPRTVRDRFERGCLGFHASLLPRLRGGAPLNWAILEGHEETGVSLFALADGVDDGLIFGQERLPIGPRTMIGELVEAAATASVELVRAHLPAIFEGRAEGYTQRGTPSYCLQRCPEDGRIDWRKPAIDIDRLVRAVSRPYPGAFTDLDGKRVHIWQTEPYGGKIAVSGMPGQLFRLPGSDRPHVVTGDGLLAIAEATDDEGRAASDWLTRAAQKRFSNRSI